MQVSHWDISNSASHSLVNIYTHSPPFLVTGPFVFYLSSWFGTFPNAEITYDPGYSKTESKFPAKAANFFNSRGYLENTASRREHSLKWITFPAVVYHMNTSQVSSYILQVNSKFEYIMWTPWHFLMHTVYNGCETMIRLHWFPSKFQALLTTRRVSSTWPTIHPNFKVVLSFVLHWLFVMQ